MPLTTSDGFSLFGVTCYDEGVRESYTFAHSHAVHRLRCAWGDRKTLINSAFNTNGNNLPYAYPDAPWMYLDQIDVTGEGLMDTSSNGGRIGYRWAVMDWTYRPINYASDGTETAAIQLDLSEQILTLGGDTSFFKWSSDNTDIPANAAPGVKIITGTVIKARYNVRTLNTSLIFSKLGTVDNSGLFGTSTGQLLYLGLSTSRTFTVSGAESWRSSHRWEFNSVGFNNLARPSTGTWDAFVVKATGSKFYSETSHAALLTT